MERRHYPRIPIDLSVLATGPKHPPLVCRMRDFCEGGALLMLTDKDAALVSSGRLVPGDPVDLRFSVDMEGKKQRFQLKAEIARAFDENLGVSFRETPSGALIQAIASLSDQTFPPEAPMAAPTSAPGTISPQAKAMLNALKVYAENKLPWRVGQFFHDIGGDLIQAAQVAGNAQEEQLIYELTREIPIKQGTLKSRFRHTLLQGFDQLEGQLTQPMEPTQRKPGDDSLSLIDKEEFDDWVHVVAIVNRGEGMFAEELFIITHVLSDLLGMRVDRESNPIGPSSICQAFHAACQELDTTPQMKRRLYWMFEKGFLPTLSVFYKEAIDVFQQRGVSTEVRLAVQRFPGAPARSAREAEDEEMSAEVREALGEHDREAASRQAAEVAASTPAAQSQAAPGQAAPRRGFLSAAKSLFGLVSGRRRKEGPRSFWDQPSFEELGAVTPEPAALPPGVEVVDESDVGALIDALDAIHEQDQAPTRAHPDEEEGPRVQLSDRVLQAMAAQQGGVDGAVRVGQPELELVGMVDSLLDNVHGDLMVNRTAQHWFRALEVPLLKAAAMDPGLLGSSDNPFALVMNEIEHLGRVTTDSAGNPDQRIARQVEEIIGGLVSGGTWDAGALEAAAGRLAALTEGQRAIVDRTVDRTVQAREGQQRLLEARARVEEEFKTRLDGISLPPAVIRMVGEGLRPILTQTLLRVGDQSGQWQNQVGVVSKLADPRRYAGKRWNDPERPEIVALVRAEFERTGASLPQSQSLLNGLEEAFDGKVSPLEWVEYVPQEEAAAGLAPSLEEACKERPAHLSEAAWRDLMEQAMALKVDDWVTFDRGEGQRQPLRLVWTGKDHRWFLFANNRGAKAEELTLPELALQFSNGTAALVEDLDLSLMDRASQKMVEQLHQEIALQASRDPLTGLLNRREFDNRVEQSVAAAIRDQMHLVLMHVDLDQFRLINITFNFQAGDQYLQRIGELLKQHSGERGIAARLGDDAFGLLLPDCTQERGLEVAEALRREVQGFRFQFKEGGSSLALTASIGATGIAPDRADPDRALKEAEAACDLAKEQGRNRVEFYHAEDSTLSDRYQLAVRVTDVMDAMQSNRLQLAGQQIMPIGPGGHRPLVEVLVRLPGAEEHSAEYLRAAQYYNRITEVDRWMVQQVFAWMHRMGKRLGLLECCAINISASSLHDVDFPVYVQTALDHHQIPPEKVCFELAEAAVTDNARRVQQAIRALKQTGCRFSVDDFGVGSAAFAHLKKVPAEYIKIAGGIVGEIAHNKEDLAMVKSINEVAHFLGKQTIAENVSSQDTLNVLKEIGVDYAQGPLISLPKVMTQD